LSQDQDLALDALLEFLNGVDAGISAARQRVKEAKHIEAEPLNFDALPWEDRKTDKGPFQQTSEKSSQNNDLWQALKAKLKENKGFCKHGGFNYWFDMKNESVIDRRKTV
jgi:hypothetical protein